MIVFIIGVMIGAVIGCFTIALCAVAGEDDERSGRK